MRNGVCVYDKLQFIWKWATTKEEKWPIHMAIVCLFIKLNHNNNNNKH